MMSFTKRVRALVAPLLLAGAVLGGIYSAQAGWWNKKPTPPPAPAPVPVQQQHSAQQVVAEGEYTDKEGIASYIVLFGKLPRNFITKGEARKLGWQGGPLEPYAPGKSIGGDRFGNYERVLPQGSYRECDVDTRGRPRGAKRIVYTTDRHVYYSDDHYRTFKRIR